MADVPLGLQVRLTRHGVNHVRRSSTSQPRTECGLRITGARSARENRRMCVDCKRAMDPWKKPRTHRKGRKDPGRRPFRGRDPDGLPRFYSWPEWLKVRIRRRMARESRRKNR